MVKNAKHDIIDVAKPRSLRLLRMVESIGPVESDISVAMVELDDNVDGPASGGLIEFEQVVGHADPVGFHWVTLAVVVVAEARLVEVGHARIEKWKIENICVLITLCVVGIEDEKNERIKNS